MKKIVIILLILISLFSLAGCKNNNNEGNPIITDNDSVLETISEQIKEIFS